MSIVRATKQSAILMCVLPFVIVGEVAAVDEDGNEFEDSWEQLIANKFCPSLVLHSSDQEVSPEPVEIVTGMLFEEYRHNPNQTYLGDAPRPDLLPNYSWVPVPGFFHDPSTLYCGNGVGTFWSLVHFDYGGPGSGCELNSNAYIDQPEGWYYTYKYGRVWSSPNGAIRVHYPRGADLPNTIYAHLFRHPNGTEWVVQYWFFYPFDDWWNNHEGDWEHINVVISSNNPATAVINTVVYYFHNRFLECNDVQFRVPSGEDFDCYVTDETHPVVFVGGETDEVHGGARGSGPGSHGSYPIWGHWSEVVIGDLLGFGDIEIDDYVDGQGLWIPWFKIVDTNANDGYGVVVIKEPSAYNYASRPEMSWLKADVRWGHPRVDTAGLQIDGVIFSPPVSNDAVRGPSHQSTWLVADEASEGFARYIIAGPTEFPGPNSAAGWVPPPPMNLTWPIEGAVVEDIVDVKGTIYYADSVAIEYGVSSTPSTWLREAAAVTAEIPVYKATIGALNTGPLPTGVYALRVSVFYSGQSYQVTRSIRIVHKSLTVTANDEIQLVMDSAFMGDTIRVSPGSYAGNLVLKETIHLIGDPGSEIVGGGVGPVVSVSNHSFPAVIDGFTIRHGSVEGPPSFSENGCGIRVVDSPLIVRNCQVRDNPSIGGGIYATGGSDVTLENVEVSGNVGGGLVLWVLFGEASPTVSAMNCVFRNNSYTGAHGGVALIYSYDEFDPPYFERCRFEENVSGSGGAAVEIEGTGTVGPVLFRDCVFSTNHATGAGAATIYSLDSRVRLENCTVVENGACMECATVTGVASNGSTVEIDRSIISGNSGAAAWGTGITMTNGVVYGNGTVPGAPSDADWTTLGVNVFNEDPAFCGSGDYTLYSFSPAAAGAHFPQGAGALEVGCAPDAIITAAPDPPAPVGADPSLVFACPAGDASKLVVTMDLDGNVVTREIGASEIVLQTPPLADSLWAYDENGDGKLAASGPASGPGFVTTIEQREFGGLGVDSLAVMINGVPLVVKAGVNVRTPDTANPGGWGADGAVNGADFAAFGVSYSSPPKPYNYYHDFNGDGMVGIGDYSAFGSHYGHSTSHGALSTPREVIVRSDVGVALGFTEEYVTSTDRRLFVDVDLNLVPGVEICVLSFRTGLSNLRLVGWEGSGSAIGDVLFTPTIRSGEPELFFGILVSEDFSGSSARLGRLIFDVESNDALVLDDDSFQLTVGDLQLAGSDGQSLAATMSSVVGRSLDTEVKQVFHNRLEQNFPNPFNPATTIAFSLQAGADVSLTIYDVAGRRVRELLNEKRNAGAYRVEWNGRNDNGQPVASGVYFYKLVAGSFTDTKKMTILK